MKKWQKITGIIALTLIAVFELLTWANSYVDMKYLIEPYCDNYPVERTYLIIDSLSFGMWLNLILALFLFVCLWRKGGKR